jgi:hypothetical protein
MSSLEPRRSEDVATGPVETDERTARRARDARRVILMIMAAFVIVGATGLLGVRTHKVSASGGGYDLTVVYPATTRPGLAIRWIVFIHRAGGFDQPVALATTSTYFNLFDFNNLDPTPSEAITTGQQSIWTFDRPPGETLRVTLDARIEPARQHGSQATTSLIVGGVTTVSVHYQTRVMP